MLHITNKQLGMLEVSGDALFLGAILANNEVLLVKADATTMQGHGVWLAQQPSMRPIRGRSP